MHKIVEKAAGSIALHNTRILQICVVISGLLCFSSCILAMSMVSEMGMLTYRSFMSSVINLWFFLMLSFVRSWARVDELTIVQWLSKFRCCCRTLLSFLAALYEGHFYY